MSRWYSQTTMHEKLQPWKSYELDVVLTDGRQIKADTWFDELYNEETGDETPLLEIFDVETKKDLRHEDIVKWRFRD